MDTLGEVVEQTKHFAGDSGTCSRDQAVSYINQARRLLWNKVDYENTQEYICIKCIDHCFYLPSRYKQIRLAWIGKSVASLGDEWYQAIPQVGLMDPRSSCHKQLVQVGGSFVTFTNYDDTAYRLGVFCENAIDSDKEITVTGKDRNGVIRRETIKPSQSPRGRLSKIYWRSILQVTKPETKGRIRFYAVDQTNQQFLLIAIYEPKDKNPEFRKYKVFSLKDCESVTLLAKLRFHEISEDNELVEFPTESMKFAITAIVSQENRDNAKYAENLALAVGEIVRETSDNEIPTASPMRFAHSDNVEALVG